jgi:hypothetical protein
MKKSTKEESTKFKVKSNPATKSYSFPNVSNENCIRIALKLLGVSDELYEKETKSSIKADLFPKNGSASSSKAFFFINQLCIKQLCSPE